MATLKVPVGPGDHIRGNKNAQVTLLEYGDYECAFCGLAHPVVQTLRDYFGDNLCFVFRHFPLSRIHPHAEMTAETAEFACPHGRFWDMHDLIYENQKNLNPQRLAELALSLNLPLPELEEVFLHHVYKDRIRRDFAGGVRSGVSGTPTFFINNELHNGSFAFNELAPAIAAAVLRNAA